MGSCYWLVSLANATPTEATNSKGQRQYRPTGLPRTRPFVFLELRSSIFFLGSSRERSKKRKRKERKEKKERREKKERKEKRERKERKEECGPAPIV